MKTLLDFMIANFAIAVLLFALLNIVVGMANAWKDNTFSIGRVWQGLKDIVLLVIGLFGLGLMFMWLQGLSIDGIPFALATFKLITTLAIAYYGNSVLQNALPLLKIPTPAFLKTIDDKVKDMFNRTEPAGIYGDEGETEAKG